LLSGGTIALLSAIAYVIQISQIGFLFQQADLALKAGEYQNAINYYDDGLKKAPVLAGNILNFEKAWIQKAYALNALKNYPAMLKACEIAATLKQKSPDPQICRGTAYDQMDKPEAAIAAYNQAISYSPDIYEAWQNRGHSYLKMGKIDQAIADFKKAISVGSDKAQVTWNDLGKLYFQIRNYNQSVAAYREAIALAPQYLPPRIGLGNALLALQQPIEAIEVYNQALAIDDKSYEAWFGKALAEERLNRLENALRSYERSIFIKPNYQAAIDARQRILEKLALPN
jgi:tetratricopeptide (TPR) repeat protein